MNESNKPHIEQPSQLLEADQPTEQQNSTDAGFEPAAETLPNQLQGKGTLQEDAVLTAFQKEAGPEFPFTSINVWESRHVDLPDDITSDHTFVTKELNGCIAVLVISNAIKNREAVFSHYPQFAQGRNVRDLDEVVTDTMRASRDVTAVVFFQDKRSETTQIEAYISDTFGENAKIIKIPYTNDANNPDDGKLIVTVGEHMQYSNWNKSNQVVT